MKLKMKLYSDTIFGNGMSIPGGEDMSVFHDTEGFPYYKGTTFKGVFREELERYLSWEYGMKNIDREEVGTAIRKKSAQSEVRSISNRICGFSGDDGSFERKAVFEDFTLSPNLKHVMRKEIGRKPELILESLTNLRTFTAMDPAGSGVVKSGSLRMARCVNHGLVFYSEVHCSREDETIIREVLPLIKWIGTMRNRGFGKVKIEVMD